MNRTLFAVGAAVIALSFSSPLFAQGGPPQMMGRGAGPGMMGPRGYIPDPATLPALKEKLGIRPEQQTQWDAFVKADQKAWAHREEMQQTAPRNQALTPEQRREMRESRSGQRAEIHTGFQTARNNLHRVLMPEQKRAFDEAVPPLPNPAGPPR